MHAYFLDSSALVKRFTRESGSAWITSLFRKSAGNSIYIARITPVEVVSGLAKQNRIGILSPPQLDKAASRLMRHIEDRYAFVDINRNLVDSAIKLVLLHGLRGFDAIQLAAAIKVAERRRSLGASPSIFVCADDSLNKAALTEGLTVDNPNDHA